MRHKKILVLGSVAVLSSAVALGVSKWSFAGSNSATTNGTINIADRTFITMPSKGDLISMDVGNTATTKFRVIKIVSDTVAEVLAMEDVTTSQVFNSSTSDGNAYSGSKLDTYCNTTYYGTLSSTAKSAIVAKTITQSSGNFTWSVSGSVASNRYIGIASNQDDYMITFTSGNVTDGVSIGSRYCYSLDVREIIEYLGTTTSMVGSNTTLNYTNILTMFWNQTNTLSKYIWLRCASASYSRGAWIVYGYCGYLYDYYYSVTLSYAVRPAFQVDLSKITFTKITSL